MSEVSEEQENEEAKALSEASAVHAFITSEAGINVLKRANERITAEWKFAATREAREDAHAKFAALEAFATELTITVETGGVVKQNQKVRERQAKQK